jgi:hypothetical protein
LTAYEKWTDKAKFDDPGGKMNIDIRANGTVTPDIALELDALGDLLTKELGIAAERERALATPGAKDGGLTIALTIAGVTLTGANTAFNILNFWRSTRNRYSISIRNGDVQHSLSNLSSKEFKKIFAEIEANNSPMHVLVSVRER